MESDPQVQHLLDELFVTHRTPEEVCVAYPELLPEVRDRWRQIRLVEADLDAIFPPPLEPGAGSDGPTCGPLSHSSTHSPGRRQHMKPSWRRLRSRAFRQARVRWNEFAQRVLNGPTSGCG